MSEQLIEGDNRLAALVHLGRRARMAASLTELGFISANETHKLVPFRQAALWLYSGLGASGKVVALSGVATVETNAPYVTWLSKLFRSLPVDETEPVRGHLFPNQLKPELKNEWVDWLPANWLLLALPATGRFKGGALLLARDEAWIEDEVNLLVDWGQMIAHAYALRLPGHIWSGSWRAPGKPANSGRSSQTRNALAVLARRSLGLIGLAALIVVAFVPVQLTVLAPAELVALNPAIVRAPMDGVVDKVLVKPNQSIQAGEALFEFDSGSLESRMKIAVSALATAQAEYRNRAQRALFDPESKAQLAILQGQIEEKRAELDYLKSLIGRARVDAPQAGVVLFGDATEWVGRPVLTGERIMMVANPASVEIEAWLSPGDAVPLTVGSPVSLYLNADPLVPLQGQLTYVAHEAVARPDGHYAYRVRAALLPDQQARVGLKGSAKLISEEVSLAYWVVRRPLAQARAWLGM